MKTRVVEPMAAEALAIAGALLSPTARKALEDVRTALKGLGYIAGEYNPIVAQLDPSAGFEKNVKNALKALRVN